MSSHSRRILLVDDFEMYRTILRNILTDMGFSEFHEAVDGAEALQKIEDGQRAGAPIEIIFSDWNMPNMTGIELLEAIRKSEAYKHIPFVMVTAEAEKLATIKALKMGANDYIVKPIAPDVLMEKVKKILQQTAP